MTPSLFQASEAQRAGLIIRLGPEQAQRVATIARDTLRRLRSEHGPEVAEEVMVLLGQLTLAAAHDDKSGSAGEN